MASFLKSGIDPVQWTRKPNGVKAIERFAVIRPSYWEEPLALEEFVLAFSNRE